MQLKPGTRLKGGNYTYRIVRVLGQGGFGITYLAHMRLQVKGALGMIESEIPVAVKEFFMKDFCNRDTTGSSVSVPSVGSREMVEKFKAKFIKEANNIAALQHPHIVKVMEVFKENGTAYYVMEYIEGCSLQEWVRQKGALPEAEALGYIRQVAAALEYIHHCKMNHLDVKPGNILRKPDGHVVLIDFGLSKQYDEKGEQTSSTPVGVSAGYAPTEQSKPGGVGQFSASTDIYSLGATLYKLVTGNTPPDASDVVSEGLPPFPPGISRQVEEAIRKAMHPGRHDRPQSIRAFNELLGDVSWMEQAVKQEKTQREETRYKEEPQEEEETSEKKEEPPKKEPFRKERPASALFSGKLLAFCGLALLVLLYFIVTNQKEPEPSPSVVSTSERGEVISSPTEIKGETVPASTKIVPSRKKGSQTIRVDNLSFTMIEVPGGTFRLGPSGKWEFDKWDEKEFPVHPVTLSDFYIGKYEVTQALWKAVMGENPSKFKGDDLPVEHVSWNDTQLFISRLNRLTGKAFRLPTDAEWQFAALGGNRSRGYRYAGSNDLDEVAWCKTNSGERTHPVGTKAPNELGIYDMSGNVIEWCEDWYGDYPANNQQNPTGPATGQYRVGHGGAWRSNINYCRPTVRLADSPERHYDNLGLRLVLSK